MHTNDTELDLVFSQLSKDDISIYKAVEQAYSRWKRQEPVLTLFDLLYAYLTCDYEPDEILFTDELDEIELEGSVSEHMRRLTLTNSFCFSLKEFLILKHELINQEVEACRIDIGENDEDDTADTFGN